MREVVGVDVGEALLLLGVGHHDPLPSLAVRSGRRLERDLQALLDHLTLDRGVEVEALAHGAGGGEDFVGGRG